MRSAASSIAMPAPWAMLGEQAWQHHRSGHSDQLPIVLQELPASGPRKPLNSFMTFTEPSLNLSERQSAYMYVSVSMSIWRAALGPNTAARSGEFTPAAPTTRSYSCSCLLEKRTMRLSPRELVVTASKP